MHFGLGDAIAVHAAEIHSPSGTVEKLTLSSVDRVFTIEEGKGISGELCELSLTPSCTSLKAQDVFATLVHEMAHYWEHVNGIKPRSPGYHGKRWWSFMEKIGLPPAPQGKNGKSRLKVFQTIKRNGAFTVEELESLAPGEDWDDEQRNR